MTAAEAQGDRRRPGRARRDLGRGLARLLCFIFAVIGAIPFSGGLLLRSDLLKKWAANETSRVLAEELGVVASFSVELSLIPLRLAVTNLHVPATDGGSPGISAELIAVSPRFFSLLAGRIDVGDIELEAPRVRLVIRDGAIMNVAYQLPETDAGGDTSLTRSPFRSLALSDAQLDLDVDGTRVKTSSIDLDVFSEEDLAFDIALRAGRTSVQIQNGPADAAKSPADVVCGLDFRIFASREKIVVRRFSLLGALSNDLAPSTPVDCANVGEERLALRLAQVTILPNSDGLPHVRGHVMVRAPLALLSRLSKGTVARGWTGFSGDVAYGGGGKLPELTGQVTGAGMNIDGYALAEELSAEVLITGDTIQIPTMHASWGNGTSVAEKIKFSPFLEGMPYSVEHVKAEGVDMPGIMRDVDVTHHSWVDWNLGTSEVRKVVGRISPFSMDGLLVADTSNFVVWDRGFDDPGRKRMVGIKAARIDGHFRANSKRLEFYDSDVTFGNSFLPIDLVSIGFRKTGLTVRMKESKGELDFKDLSPIANVELEGKSKLYVNLEGPNLHPVLVGDVSVTDLVVGGFPAGNILHSDVRFEPLFVEFSNLTGRKGSMDYAVDRGRLSFDGPASVLFTAKTRSSHFDIEEFFRVFHFDEDPRFSGIKGTGVVEADVQYLLGGPSDTCQGGRLTVHGSGNFGQTELFGERYNSGEATYEFDWFDIEAGTRGMRVQIPSFAIRKGSGSILGSLGITAGGKLAGDVLATRIPVSRVDALGAVTARADGFISGAGEIFGTADAPAFAARVDVSRVKFGDFELKPSQLKIRMVPEAKPAVPKVAPLGTTGCGREISAPFSRADYDADKSDGAFVINGKAFGHEIEFHDLTVSQQRKRVVSGKLSIHQLNLKTLASLAQGNAPADVFESGSLSGEVVIDKLYFDNFFAGALDVKLSEASLSRAGLNVHLADPEARVRLQGGKLAAEHFALRAVTPAGQEGLLDVSASLDKDDRLDATFQLRPTDLAIFASTLEGVDRARGKLEATVSLSGPLESPTLSGSFDVRGDEIVFDGLTTPVTDLSLKILLDAAGLHVDKGSAHFGGGEIVLTGDAPFTRGKVGQAQLSFAAQGISLPLGDEARVKFDATLALVVPPADAPPEELPRLSGTVDVLSALYETPMRVTADISSLTARGAKTNVAGYDADKDKLKLDILVRSSARLRVENELVKTSLLIDPQGLHLTGTDQRFGAVGTIEVEPGGSVFLRRNEFELQRGLVRFNDPTRLRPQVDVTAVTEYRRYEDRGGADGDNVKADTETSGPTAGTWRIALHAYGPPDDLKIDLNSDPALAQDDLFLLLTVGLTRTELDQTQSSGVGSSVALEALGSLSGAEGAVTDIVPIDEFRFGSSYSSRSGRTEPTVTIGKRLSRRIRASVTTSLSDSSEVRTNVEYRATDRLSVQGAYDNAGDVASAAGGNLGGDVRWRLEFE